MYHRISILNGVIGGVAMLNLEPVTVSMPET